MRCFWRYLTFFMLAMCMTSCASASGLEARFYNAGKADACLLQTEHSTVLIDTGTNKFGKELVDRLKAEGISEIDVLFITHFDKDHVGGADKVLEQFKVHQIYVPNYFSDSKQYTQYQEALEAAGLQAMVLDKNISFELDGVTYVVDVANQTDYGRDEENDFSLVIGVYFDKVSLLLAGDAENPRLSELIAEGLAHFDVLKVPHHGRSEKLSARFFHAISPDYAIITSDEEDLEEDDVVYMLSQYGQVYLTRMGDVVCTTDGTAFSVVQE